MKTEEIIKKLNAHYEQDCLKVDATNPERIYFNINIPFEGHGGLNATFKQGQVLSIDQWNGFTSILMVISNEELAEI